MSEFMFQKDYSFCINRMYWILDKTASEGLSKFDKLNCFKLLDALRTSKFIMFVCLLKRNSILCLSLIIEHFYLV